MDNAIIQLGDIDDSQKGRQFKSRFIQAGIAGYPKQFGNVLITKETLDKFVNTLVDKPVIINHKDEIKPEDEVGKVTKVWFNSEDGWFWCEGYLTDETAINLIKDKGWSVSCSYDVLLLDDEGGTENNIKYDKEFLNGKFTHLAIVENPRYERANIVVNSKTEVINNDRWITVHPNGEDEEGRHLLIKDGEDLKEAMQRQWGVYDKRQAKLKSDDKTKEKSILDTIAERDKKAKELKEKGVLKDLKMPKTFEEQQQEDIDKGELVELGKFPTHFTSEVKEGFSGESQKPLKQEPKQEEKSEDLETVRKEYEELKKSEPSEEEVLKQIEEHAGEKRKQREAAKQSESPFGEGVKEISGGRSMSGGKTVGYVKDNKGVSIEDFGDGAYKVNYYDGTRLKEIKYYSTKKGMEKSVKAHLQGANKEAKALETKTSLEDAEAKYNEVLKRYNENDRKRWQSGLSNHEYYKAYDEAEKAKKELTTARREYAESIMSNFEAVEENPYEERQEARRARYEELSEKAGKESEAVYKQSHDMISAIPMGQPILIGHHSEKRDRAYRQRAWDKLGKSFELSKKSDYYAGKAKSVGKAGISADDANAIAKLAQKYKSGVTSAEKRRIIDRVIDIHKNAKRAADTTAQTDYSDLGFQVERNADMNRLQLKFNGKPDEKTRSILKSNGFRWSPTQGAWQRQLNGNSEYGLKRVVEGLKKVDNSLTKGIYKIFNNYIPTIEDIPLLQGLIDILENR